MRILIPVLLAVLAAGEARSQDTKTLADGLIRHVRAHQAEDGGYGDLATTCRVLDLLGRSPRRYNELDGPLFRRAAELVAADHDPDLDARRVLALAGAVTPPLIEARARSLERLMGDERRRTSDDGLLALAVMLPEGMPAPPTTSPGDPPERAVLLVDDPTQVPPPSVQDRRAWSAWARGARLRGVKPPIWPDPPAPSTPDTPLDELLDRLELVLAIHGLAGPPTAGEDAPPLPARRDAPRLPEDAVRDGLAWLEAHQDAGTFGLEAPGWDGPEPGVTALCLSAAIRGHDMLGLPRPTWVAQGLDWLASLQRPDGSIQTYGVAVYTTSVAMEALLDGGRVQDAEVVALALEFLLASQADEGEGYSLEDDPLYGGVGYGGDERPDLSNTNIAAEAAERAGLASDHPFFQRMLVFLERNQNRGEESPWRLPRKGGGEVVAGTDGGATYMPGNSPAGEDEVAAGVYVARSYGSMTYALTKSYLICGLPSDDARVAAAVRWILENFTLETNPGFSDPRAAADGLYYYYLALARTLSRISDDLLLRPDGSNLDWRARLTRHLTTEQRVDGSWINERSSRWYEGAPTLCTAFAMLSLAQVDAYEQDN